MNGLLSSLGVECLKIGKSKVFPITIVIFSFVGVMMGVMVLVARHPGISGRSAMVGAKASLVGNADWPSYYSLLIQIVLSLGAMGFGFVTSWVFGREFVDRTVKDLLALPVARSAIVLSKFAAITAWCSILIMVLWFFGFVAGLCAGIPNWSAAGMRDNFRMYCISAVLTMLLSTPVAFFANLGRGYLLPIGFTVVTLIMTNLVAVGAPGLAPYFPWAFPALASGVVGDAIPHLNGWSYMLTITTIASGYFLTIMWWRFADQT